MVSLILVVTVGIFLLTIAIPGRYFGNYLGFAFIIGAPIWFFVLRADAKGGGIGFAFLILLLVTLASALVLGLLVKLLIFIRAAAEHCGPSSNGELRTGNFPLVLARYQTLIIGGMFAVYHYDELSYYVTGIQKTWIAYAAASVLPSLTGISGLVRTTLYSGNSWCRLTRYFFNAFSISSVFLLIGGVLFAGYVADRAEAAAAQAPYCLQRSQETPIETLLQLSPLLMRGKSGYHSLMVVERADGLHLLHWSYWKGDYEPSSLLVYEGENQQFIHCRLRSHLAMHLPLVDSW